MTNYVLSNLPTNESIHAAILVVCVVFAISVCVLIHCNYLYYQDERWRKRMKTMKFIFHEKHIVLLAILFIIILLQMAWVYFI